jgi:primosomal protein N' (replication factor Y)
MRLELKAGNRTIFSRALAAALDATLGRHEQAILFLNRRGNATFINCRDCGNVVKCRHCDVPMSYHSQGERLLCHRCNAREVLPTICGACGSWRIRYFGLGTQKVELEMRRRYPRARVQRYDRDATSGRLGHEKILDKFAAGEIDVLVGTQLVAKGLDFPHVTLVGAVSADTSLNLPDFRSAERTFSLLTQVSGRAGRADLPGVVVVQTYTPEHFAIVAAADHDYPAFYRDELRFRREGLYPPFSRLARLIKTGSSDAACRDEARALAERLSKWEHDRAPDPAAQIEIIGPAPCFIGKVNDRFFWQILLRGDDVHPILAEVPRGWAIDVDPMSLL